MVRFPTITALCVLAMHSVLACDDDDDALPVAADGQAGASGTGGSAGLRDASVDAPADANPLATQAANLSDAEMVKVVEVANTGEVRQGLLAQKKAQSTPVREFASDMAEEHLVGAVQLKALAKSLGVSPEESQVGTMMATVGDAVMRDLTMRPQGPDFDLKYMEVQVAQHESVLSLVDQMGANADASELRAYLTEARTAIQEHLDEAREVLAGL